MASAPRRTVSHGRSEKVVEKLKQKIRDGEYYEAHQTYKMLYQRYCAQGRGNEAIQLLFEGARLLLENRQLESGTDLALLLISHLKLHQTSISEELFGMVTILFECMRQPNSADAAGVGSHIPVADSREAFLRAALKWTNIIDNQSYPYGHPQLHKMAAQAYTKEKNYVQARQHYLHVEMPEEFGILLMEVATTKGYPGEADLFITQAVLQLLVLKQRTYALDLYNIYTQAHPAFRDKEGPPYKDLPLLNFLWFLLLSAERGQPEVFNCLLQHYTPAIQRDPCFQQYLTKIGEYFFGIASSQPSGGLFDLIGGTSGFLSEMFEPQSSANTISSLNKCAGAEELD